MPLSRSTEPPRDCPEALVRMGLVGASPAFQCLVQSIGRLAAVDLPVLLTGESGTGKELAARAIHYLGGRRDRPFVPVDCGALPDTLFAAEVYGHLRGAFTDARRDRPGLVAEAEGGTLFFDEVHALSLQSQAALLRFLQERTYRPLGAGQGRQADVRVVAATNRELASGIDQGWFREDLYYRLNVAALRVPSLRERSVDIRPLVECCVQRFCTRYGRPPCRFDAQALAWIESQPWRGNIRELESFVQRCLLAGDGPVLCIDGFGAAEPGPPERDAAGLPAFNQARAQALAAFERSYLELVLTHNQGNVSAAARQAGKERRVFGRLMKKHGIAREPFARGSA
jgi:two-component system response regulator GlrR